MNKSEYKNIIIIIIVIIIFIRYLINANLLIGTTVPPRILAHQDLVVLVHAFRNYYDKFQRLPEDINEVVGITLRKNPVDPWGYDYMVDTKNYEIYCIDRDENKRYCEKYWKK